MKHESYTIDGNRYMFDFSLLPSGGWCQIDTEQDCQWHGNWANPFQLRIVSFVEGDVCDLVCETEQEFVQEMRRIGQWYKDHVGSLPRIDTGGLEQLQERWKALGLGEMLYEVRES
jgi:hypothetical protein